MSDAKIVLTDYRVLQSVPRIPGTLHHTTGMLLDTRARPLRDLRISVTDRCNFRCTYCMPREVFGHDHVFLPHSALLSFEEITRLARLFVAHGVEKIRLTGGEPLLRKNIEQLIAMLAELRTPAGHALDITLTTNGSLLAKKAQTLKDAGLQRITVSLDSLDDRIFRHMNDADFPVNAVLEGIAAAQQAGLAPIKVNMVVKKGTNDSQIIPMARHFRGSGIVLRFIEFMDVGASNGWNMTEVLPSAEVLSQLQQHFSLTPIAAQYSGETASRWRYREAVGSAPTLPAQTAQQEDEIGLISSVTQAFCHDCTRARLSTEGKLYLCLFARTGYDLRALLRQDCSDLQIANAIASIWQQRNDRYSELRGQSGEGDALSQPPKIEMSYIGG